MPTYEFACPAGHEFERFFRKISDGLSEVPCPECAQTATRRLSGAGLVFKGSGFYLTDYGKNAHKKAPPGSSGEPGSKGEASGTEAGASGAGDSKAGESRSGEPRAGESKAADAKSGDTKSSEVKSGTAKPRPSGSADAPSSAPGKRKAGGSPKKSSGS